MRIYLHIGLQGCGHARIQHILAQNRGKLTQHGIRFAISPGEKNHTRLWQSVTDPGHITPIRGVMGYNSHIEQADLLQRVSENLENEVDKYKPSSLILSAWQMCWVHRKSELHRLRSLLRRFSHDIKVIAWIDGQASLLPRIYAEQVLGGRAESLQQEMNLSEMSDWWSAALEHAGSYSREPMHYIHTQASPFWLDYLSLRDFWEGVFGPGALDFIPYNSGELFQSCAPVSIYRAFGIDASVSLNTKRATPPPPPSAISLARARQLNNIFQYVNQKSTIRIPSHLWRRCLAELSTEGPPISFHSMGAIRKHFSQSNRTLLKRDPHIPAELFSHGAQDSSWSEPTTCDGFRATQYLASFWWRIEKYNRDVSKKEVEPLSETARSIFPPAAIRSYFRLQGSNYAPHNDAEYETGRRGNTNFSKAARGETKNHLIIACMKNEAPYILEWIAYHRAIGASRFVIYTNSCDDNTVEILRRLDLLGIVLNRSNDHWRGSSPQQFALNSALRDPAVESADWITHIDVDEFINIRCGNGTFADLHSAVPDASHIAMTWRLFGHNNCLTFEDRFVTDQFTRCAPSYCPKPHTVWGFKTLGKNMGAYQKLSGHRPNKLRPEFRDKVTWVNGSGVNITSEVAERGWRSSTKSIGYDLVQLNHYALRSAESFLVKRDRGRALHVDRSVGKNYWLRMDWNDHTDRSILRNSKRLREEYDELLADPKLRALHLEAVAWHKEKVRQLKKDPEFLTLYEEVQTLKLSAMERAAYAMTFDTDS